MMGAHARVKRSWIIAGTMLVLVAAAAAVAVFLETSGGSNATAREPAPAESKGFTSVADAAHYGGFTLREPRSLPLGWKFANALAIKNFPGTENQFVVVELHYDNASSGSRITLVETPANIGPAVAGGHPQAATVQGVPATIDHGSNNPNLVSISWHKGGMNLQATTILSDNMNLDNLESLLESID